MSIRYWLKAIYPYAIWLTVFGLLAAGIGRAEWMEAFEGRLVFRGAQTLDADIPRSTGPAAFPPKASRFSTPLSPAPLD